MKIFKTAVIAGIVATALSGCGNGSSVSAPVTLSVSDAPVDGLTNVVVVFSKVALLPIGDDNAEPLIFNLSPLSVNLLEYQGSDAKALIENEMIPVGRYKMCVFANNGDYPDSTYQSYVINENDGQHPLTVEGDGSCPQGVGTEADTGVLYFNETFTVNTGNNQFVIEFDLRRGIKQETDNNYTIQRTSVDVVNQIETGTLDGNVDSINTYGACQSDTLTTNGYAHAVYLYQGDVLKEDMGPLAGTSGSVPLTSANVVMNNEGGYEYEFGYLAPGTYSVGYTCTANDDSADGLVEDADFSIYKAQSGIVVTANEKTEANL